MQKQEAVILVFMCSHRYDHDSVYRLVTKHYQRILTNVAGSQYAIRIAHLFDTKTLGIVAQC